MTQIKSDGRSSVSTKHAIADAKVTGDVQSVDDFEISFAWEQREFGAAQAQSQPLEPKAKADDK